MPRTPDPNKRAELLRAITEYLQEHGVADLSLAPLAEKIGTSKRMLLYYFHDRGTLLAEALAANRLNVSELFEDAQDREGLRAGASTMWHAIATGGAQHRFIRLQLQVLSLATTQPEIYGSLAVTAVHVMTQPIAAAFERAGFAPAEAEARATLVVSGLRGLCQDLLVTDDRERVDAAAEMLIDAATS
jgi:AcrR family transcriptional regulator